MVTIVRKEYRKPYILTQGGYQDMMRTTWDKSVWNSILEVDPMWAEFLFVRAELPDAATAAEIRHLRYVKQSEFKKHYLNGLDYVDMEYLWTGFIPGFWPPGPSYSGPGRIDAPWDVPNDIIPPGEGAPSYYICDADSDGCYCPGGNSDVTVTANHPIVGIQFVFREGETIVGVQPSWGQNTVVITIRSPARRSGQMRLRVWLQLPNGALCDSENNIYKCDVAECCPCDDFEWDWDLSTETLSPGNSATVYVKGGEGPYHWEIESEDGKWTLDNVITEGPSNVVNALADACGSATMTVTPCDGAGDCEAVGSIRNPGDGQWVRICGQPAPNATTDCCYTRGAQASLVGSIGTTQLWQATQGKYRQSQTLLIQGCHTEAWNTAAACNNQIDICCGPVGTGCRGFGGWGGPIDGGVSVKATCQYINFVGCLTLGASQSSDCGSASRLEGSNYYRSLACFGSDPNWSACHICQRDCLTGGGFCGTGYYTDEWKC